MSAMRPSWTTTSSVHESGQSSGQTVVTTCSVVNVDAGLHVRSVAAGDRIRFDMYCHAFDACRHHRRRVRRTLGGARCCATASVSASRCSTGAITTSFSRCCIRWRRPRCRPATSRRRSAGCCDGARNVRVLHGRSVAHRRGQSAVELTDGGDARLRPADRRPPGRVTPTSATPSGNGSRRASRRSRTRSRCGGACSRRSSAPSAKWTTSAAARTADVRARWRRSDRCRAGRHARRDCPPDAARRVPRRSTRRAPASCWSRRVTTHSGRRFRRSSAMRRARR